MRRNVELFLLNGNATIADADIDVGGLLPLLVILIAENHRADGKRPDDDVKNIAIHV